MESVKHQIEYKRLDEIRPYDNNPRRNDEAAKAVANSIKEFGFQSPIIVDRDGVIIAGHTRYKAARRLKLQEVPVIVAAELDPEKVKALRIADNSTGEVAEWDLQLLVQELTGIDYDMADFGLNLQIKIDEEVKEDNFTAEPPEQLMDGQLADLLLTDPPYNVNYEGANGKKIENDNMAEGQFRQFLLQAYSRAFEACRAGASAYIFHADTEGEAFRAMFREAGWGLHGCLVWVKNSLVLGHSDYQWQHEPCLYGWKPGANHYFVNDRSQTTVIDDAKPDDLRHMKKDQLLEWAIKAQELLTQKPSSVIRCDKPPRNAEHPTMKPVVLCGRLIKNSSLPGQTVLDLFGGSGSTLIACEQLSRKCYTMEYDPRYVDVIVQRWEDFTGEKAVRLK